MELGPPAFDQTGLQAQATREAGEARGLRHRLGPPGGQAKVLAAREQQAFTQGLDGGPVGDLRVLPALFPVAQRQAGVVGATCFGDRIELGTEGQVVAGGQRSGNRLQQIV